MKRRMRTLVWLQIGLMGCMQFSACGEPDLGEEGTAGAEHLAKGKPELAEGRYALLGDAAAPPSDDSEYYQDYHEEKSGDQRIIQIAAKTLVLDKADAHQYLARFNQDQDVKRLDLYAERLTIRTKIEVPGAEVHIHARELRFEDEGSEIGMIDATPKSETTRAPQFQNGADGRAAGDIYVYASSFHSQNHRPDRLVAAGGRGQAAGFGSAGRNGSSATLLTTSHPDLVRCGESYGLARGVTTTFPNTIIPAQITLAELKSSGIHADTPFPTNGTNAQPGGRPGSGADGGDALTNVANLGLYVRLSGSGAGAHGGFHSGGSAGTPVNAIKPGVLQCRSLRVCTEPFGNCTWVRKLVVDRIERSTTVRGANADPVPPLRAAGNAGTVQVQQKPFAWIHPHAVEMIVTYADDAFLNGFRDLAKQILEEELTLITNYSGHSSWADVSDEDKQLFGKQLLRIRSTLNRLNAHEDYFGNPLKWVPALSLEANAALFEKELQWAVRTIFVADWIVHENHAQKSKLQALTAARTILREQVTAAEQKYNDALSAVPTLKIEAENLQVRIDDLTEDLTAVQALLMQRAQDNVEERHKVPWWKKGLTVLAGVAKVFPVGQPILAGIGTTLDLINNYDEDKPLDSILKVPDVISSFKKSETDKKAADAKTKADETKAAAETAEQTGNKESLKQKLKELQAFTKPIIEELKKHKDLLKDAEAPETEVTAELEKLKGEDPEFQRLSTTIQKLVADKATFATELTRVIETLEQSLVIMSEGYQQIGALIPQVGQSAEVIIDQKAELTLKTMRDQAIKRLMKYQYWLAKAYEYRTLRSYEGDLTLFRLFEQAAALVSASNTGSATPAELESLAVIFRNELSTIINEILSYYTNNAAPQTVPVSYTLTPDELARVNSGESLSLNFWEKNLFRAGHEDIRVVRLEVQNLTTTQTGSSQSFAYMDVDMEHSGISRIWRNNKVHVFQHYNKQTQQPMRWSTRLQNGAIENHVLSASADSLVRALTGTGTDIMLFSRPSAWSDILLKKTVVSDGNVDFQITGMTLRLTYDYVPGSSTALWSNYRSGQNQAVQSTYQTLFERGASEAELGMARELLDLGYDASELSAALVTQHYKERLETIANGLYRNELSREGSEIEVAWASAELDRGRTETQLAEYIDIITHAIADTYGRDPTYDELVFYTGLLDDGWL